MPMPPPDLQERAMFLAEAVAPGDTALLVKWLIRIDAEQMYVRPRRPGKIDAHLEVTERGANGTTPATHSAGAHVLWRDNVEDRWWDEVIGDWVD